MNNITKYTLVLCTILAANFLFAGVTGKIRGKVFDSSNRLPLPGANVMIDGTNYGAATDENGEFIILHVSPGNYSVTASMIGYQKMTISQVNVMTDLTTELEFKLAELSLSLEDEVIVVAKKKIIQKDVTASVQNIEIKQLEKLPMPGAKEALMVQAGVFFNPVPVVGGLGSAGKGEKRYSVRGGDQDEILWFVDGARTANLMIGRADWGGSFTNVNMYAIKEVQMMTGGYTAEYGNAQSAIVNVITKSGNDNNFFGAAEYIFSPAGQRHFGNYLYDRTTQKEFLDHTLPDGSLDPNWWTKERQQQIYDYTDIPDHTFYLSFVGPLFSINGNKLKFFTAANYDSKAYSMPHPRDSRIKENYMVTFSYSPEAMKFKFSGFYNHDAHSTLQENGDFTNQAKYSRGWGSLLDTYSWFASIDFTHVLSNDFFYQILFSTYWSHFLEKPSSYNLVGVSEKPTLFGFHRYNGFEDEPFDKFSPTIYNDMLTGDISLVGNINWQFDKSNLLKSGFEFRYNTYDERENLRLPSFTRDKSLWLNRGLNETYHPLQFGFYVQDKMEFESMILNIGLRYDYFNPNMRWFKSTNIYNLAVNPNYDLSADPDNDDIDDNGNVRYSFNNVLNQPRESAKDYHMFSPRFGVSFPISENSLLHFNYGHYMQLPAFEQMFEFAYFRPEYIVKNTIKERELAAAEGREEKHIKSNSGDPERVVAYTNKPLKPQKTIMFEVGMKQNFDDFAVLDVTAFYKDVFDQTTERIGLFDHFVYGWDPIEKKTTPNVAYQTFIPGDYGDSRGVEISFRTLFSNVVTLDLNYSYSKSTSGRATPRVVRIGEDGEPDYEWDVDVNKRIPVEKNSSRPHILRANLFLKYPNSENSSLLNTIMKDMSMSILFRYISGSAFTYLEPDDHPDTYNNQRMPALTNFDLRIEKAINIHKSHTLSAYLYITNLMNEKNLRSYGDGVFDSEATKKFIEDGTVSTTDAAGYDISWQNYFEKRRIYFGVKYSF